MINDIDGFARWTKSNWGSGTSVEYGSDFIPRVMFTEKDMYIMSTGMPGEVGEVLELLKKRVRDNHFDIDQFKKEMGDVIHYWTMLCNFFGVSPSEVLQLNHDKIVDRKERNVMSGSGNDR
jgi:NTP pyrophosphatase (non-canonical NTP hydrolase)